jgi:hypothetical protein
MTKVEDKIALWQRVYAAVVQESFHQWWSDHNDDTRRDAQVEYAGEIASQMADRAVEDFEKRWP